MKSPLVLLKCLLQGCNRLLVSVNGIDRDLITIEHRYRHEGLSFLTKALPALCDALDRGLSDGWFVCPRGFKTVPGRAIPRLFSGMLNEVFDVRTGQVLENPSVDVVKCLREILRIFKKLQLTTTESELLDKEAKLKFHEVDSHVRNSLDERRTNILTAVAVKVLRGLDNSGPQELNPRHGPGAVAERLTPNQKWLGILQSLPLLDGYGLESLSWLNDLFCYETSAITLSEMSRLVTVPKDSTSRRTITIEPVLQQFKQQGLRRRLLAAIKRCSILSKCIDINSQAKNQYLALAGSLDDEWATIDLSSASDLLSLELVEKVFEEHSSFLELLLDARTQRTDGYPDPMKKFAGMGNATTFPVQSVVFAVIAIAAICDQRHEWPEARNVERIAQSVQVYGDDIVVPTCYAENVVLWLEAAGLRVNRRKSFLRGHFKESCGVDAFMGQEVQPVYVRYLPEAAHRSKPEVIEHLVSVANSFFIRGHYEVATYLTLEVERSLGKRLPYVRPTSGGLGWHLRSGGYTVQKWNGELHRFEVRTFSNVQKYEQDDVPEGALLFKAFLTESDASCLFPKIREHIDTRSSAKRGETRLVYTWVAA